MIIAKKNGIFDLKSQINKNDKYCINKSTNPNAIPVVLAVDPTKRRRRTKRCGRNTAMET
jgi:hypothetical protein